MLGQHVDAPDATDGLDGLGRVALGEAQHRRRVLHRRGLLQRLRQPHPVPRGREAQTGHDVGQGHVPHAVVGRAVVAGDARPVEHERDPGAVQGAVHEQLIEGAVEEGGVDADHRVQSPVREPCGHRHRVLLGDPDVEHPLGVCLGEPLEAHRDQHRGGQRHQVPPPRRKRLQGVTELVGPGPATHLQRQPGLGVDHPDGVELVGGVVARRVVALPLARDHVHDHRRTVALGLTQRDLHGLLVVPIDRPDILHPEVLEQPLRGEHVLQALLHAVQRAERGTPDDRRPADPVPAPGQQRLVPVRRPQPTEVFGDAADRRRVAAGVVVDDDDQRQIPGDRQVVERLPGHTAGERAVADDRHRMASLPPQAVGPGDPRRPGQRGRGVAVLHHVVLGLGAARVSGQAALGA